MKTENKLSEDKFGLGINFRRLAIVTLIFSCVAFAGIWKFVLQNGTIGHNWDWSIPPLSEQLRYMAQQSFQIWSDTSFGQPVGSQLNTSPLSFFIGSFGYLGFDGAFVSKFLMFLVILISGVSMFYLVHSILNDETKHANKVNTFFASFIAGYLYALSPFIFSEFIGGAYTQFFAYSLIPAVLYFCRKMKIYSKMKLGYVFITTILFSLIGVSLNALALVLLILLLYTIFLGSRHMAKGLIVSFLLYVPLNLYWLVPFLSEMASGTSSLSTSNALYLPNLFNAVPSMSEIFVGAGYARPFYMWVLNETIAPIWAIVTFSFLLCVLVSLLLFHKTKETFFWITLYIASLVVVTVGKSPIGSSIVWLYQNISLMALYRSPQHLIILTTVPLAIAVGLGTSAILSLSQKKMTQFSSIRRRKTLAATIIIAIFLSASIWVSPFFTGNLGADYLQSKGGGNFVNTFNLSPDLVTALEKINSENDSGAYRTLFLPPSNSPYYLETLYQEEGQGGDVVIGSTPRGIGDASNSYTEPLVASIRDSFENGTFQDPLLLQIANIKYIILRNDVKPISGPYANMWNFNKTLSNLEQIDGLKLIYEGPHVSLWEYKNNDPLIYAAKNSTTADIQEKALISTPVAETTKINFDDIELRSHGTREVIYNNIPPVPIIHFQEVDSSTYKVSVVNATQPFYLILSETYNPSWQVYEGSVNWLDALTKKPFSAEHFLVNIYANAWYINKTGTYSITLYYSPQATFYASSIVSFITFTGCFIWLLCNYAKRKLVKKRIEHQIS